MNKNETQDDVLKSKEYKQFYEEHNAKNNKAGWYAAGGMVAMVVGLSSIGVPFMGAAGTAAKIAGAAIGAAVTAGGLALVVKANRAVYEAQAIESEFAAKRAAVNVAHELAKVQGKTQDEPEAAKTERADGKSWAQAATEKTAASMQR